MKAKTAGTKKPKPKAKLNPKRFFVTNQFDGNDDDGPYTREEAEKLLAQRNPYYLSERI